MATFLQTLIPLLYSIAFLLNAPNAIGLPLLPKSPSKTTSFSYDFNGVKPTTDLTYKGDAYFPSDSTYLRLTQTDNSGNALQSRAGQVVYSRPIIFWDKKSKANFETSVKFIIKPINGDPNGPADGLVFFIDAVNSSVRESGGYFGAFDISGKTPSVFAVEFDIFVNEDFDPSFRHVGIDIESQVSSNVTAVDDGIVGQEVTASIKYDAVTHLISVQGSAGGKSFEVSYVHDLSSILPQNVQVGISGATGGAVAVHDVISWSFSSTMVRKKNC